MVDCLDGLWHNAVVSSNNQNCQVSGLCTTGTHGGKRLVTWGIQEGDGALATVDIDLGLVCTNTLGNTAGFARAFVGTTNRIQKAGLTVVNVTHDGNNWRTLSKVFFSTLVITELQVKGLQQFTVFVFWGNNLNIVVDLSAQQLQGLFRNGSSSGHHFTEIKQCLYQCCWICTDLLGEVSQGCATTQAN